MGNGWDVNRFMDGCVKLAISLEKTLEISMSSMTLPEQTVAKSLLHDIVEG
jgi:hypothetical protein